MLSFTLIALQNLGQEVKTENFTITGNIQGNVDGKKVYLFFDSEKQNPLDSTLIKNGIFKFKGHINEPHLYHILIIENGKRWAIHPAISLFLENSDIKISTNVDSIPKSFLLYEKNYPYNKLKISGSKSHDLFVRYFDENNLLKKKYTDANHAYTAYLSSRARDQKITIHDGIIAVNAIDVARNDRLQYVKQFIKTNSSNAVSLTVAQINLGNYSVKQIDTLLNELSPGIKETEYGKQLLSRAEIVKKTAPGSKFVDFSFQDTSGKVVTLSNYLGRGKYVLLELWASWCAPCIKDIPHLKSVYQLYHPSGFEVIQISMDDDKAKWLKAVNDQQMNWLQISDLKAFNGEFSKVYDFESIPTCILIGPNGEIITRNMRGSWMDKKLIELYGDKFEDK